MGRTYNLQTLFPRAQSGIGSEARGYMQSAGSHYAAMDRKKPKEKKSFSGTLNSAFGGAMVGTSMQEAGVFDGLGGTAAEAVAESSVPVAAEAMVPEAGVAVAETLLPEAVAGAVPEAAAATAAAVAPEAGAASMMAGPWGVGLFALGTTFAYLMG